MISEIKASTNVEIKVEIHDLDFIMNFLKVLYKVHLSLEIFSAYYISSSDHKQRGYYIVRVL